MARRIAEILRIWIADKRFELTNPVANIPGKESGIRLKNLEIKEKR